MEATLVQSDDGIEISVPMKMKRKSGRKEIIAPSYLKPDPRTATPTEKPWS